MMNHLRIVLTSPRSAPNTPNWQVTELNTRMVVLTAAKGTLGLAASVAQTSGLTDRKVKYIAKRAAKNINSLDSPTRGADCHHVGTVLPAPPGAEPAL